MHRYDDENVLQLYLSVKSDNGPMVNEIQRYAVDFLAMMARDGNTEAGIALEDLARAPMIHPILLEQIRSVIGTSARAT
ncbi:MAG: hypothetical protein PWP08_582 [Methanofollis sp.]|nr:hypothetical protein [Methanofollis sp.]